MPPLATAVNATSSGASPVVGLPLTTTVSTVGVAVTAGAPALTLAPLASVTVTTAV